MIVRFSPPQGFPAGAAPATVQVATSTATSAASSGTWSSTGTWYPLAIPVPDGATAIVSVAWATYYDNGWANPQGYPNGDTSDDVALLISQRQDFGSILYWHTYRFSLAGDLALSTAGITVPADFASTTYNCAVVYYGT